MAQMQLLQEPLAPGDIVYTPDWVARDMVSWFQPVGKILEPCKGTYIPVSPERKI